MSTCEANVIIPSIHWESTTKRILTMQFIDGCKITDAKAIQKMGLRTQDVSTALSQVFNHQKFL